MKDTKQSLPTHRKSPSSPSSSISGTSTPPTKFSLPTKLITKRWFLPSLVTAILFLLYSTNNLYNSSLGGAKNLLSSKLNLQATLKGGSKDSIWDDAGREIGLDQSLETRLKDWEGSPLEGIEPSDWVLNSIKTCSPTRITPNQNKVQLEQSHLLWSTLNSKRIGEHRREMISYLRKAKADGRMGPSAWGEGKGLVFTAGNADTFSRVLTSLKLLNKHLETHLPVEIFSFPGEVPSDDVKRDLEAFGAKFMVVESAVKDSTKAKSYHIKATAIIRSSFREVLYLDSDNLPTSGLSPVELSSPGNIGSWAESAGLWEAKAYKRLGVMFWSDYWRSGADNPIWAIIGVPCRDEWEQEAGQILIDKSLHLDTLLLSEWMMDSSRFKYWMNFSDGDKDVFRYSFLALRKRWGVPGAYVGVGAFPSDAVTGFGGHTMLQHDHVGKPLFVHANLLKQIPSGIGPGYAWGKTKVLQLPPSSPQLPTSSPFLPNSGPFEDHDVDCDHLANADFEGNAIKPTSNPAIRRRAVMERGIAAFWHGGWISALCIDISYKDTRTPEELAQQRSLLSLSHQLTSVPTTYSTILDEEENISTNVTITKDGIEMYWGESALTVKEWSDDIRLKDFERVFFEEGGVLSAPGF